MMVSYVRGQFINFTANVEADDIEDLTSASIVFQFQGNSINTNNRERDKHLKSVDFFDIEKYPTIDFISTSISKSEYGYDVTGNLTIKSITKPVTFAVEFGGKAIDPHGVNVYGYRAEATINREEFGLTWNTILETGGVLVGKEVEILVELELNEPNGLTLNAANLGHPTLIEDNNLDTNSDDIHQVIVENLTDFVAVIDRNGTFQYISPSFEKVLHNELPQWEENNLFEKIHQDDRDTIKNEIKTYFDRTIKNILNSEFRLILKEGNFINVEATIISINNHSLSHNDNELLLFVMHDISERKDAEKAIYQLAFHDSLTSLPNRRSFMNKLLNEVMHRKSPVSKLSVLFIDIDNFKQINDQWGHDVGDIALQETAKRIRSIIRPKDIAARFGGDEFVVMIRDVQDEKEVIEIVENMLDQIQNPINKFGHEFSIACSIGVAHYPDHGDSPEDLVKNADTALYYVKERGKNDFMIFNKQMEHQSLERRILESALRQGIKEEQFYLEYQPKMDMSTNEIIGIGGIGSMGTPGFGGYSSIEIHTIGRGNWVNRSVRGMDS